LDERSESTEGNPPTALVDSLRSSTHVRRVSVVLASFLTACQSAPRVEILPPRAMLVQPVLPTTVAPRHKS
jgi:hypothetical protein